MHLIGGRETYIKLIISWDDSGAHTCGRGSSLSGSTLSFSTLIFLFVDSPIYLFVGS